MKTLFEQQGGQYEMQGDYKCKPILTISNYGEEINSKASNEAFEFINGRNQTSKSPKDLEVFFSPFLEESNFRNILSMVQCK